jgi:hypothetical protein
MVMSFSLQPHGYKVATPKVSSRMGNRRNLRASLSSRRSVQWAKQGEARLPRLIPTLADETIPSPGVRLSATRHQTRWGRGWHLGFLGAHCATVVVETERLVWHCTPRATSSAGSSGGRIELGQVAFPRTPGIVSSDRLLADWRGFCWATMVTLVFFLPTHLGSRSKPLGAR